MGIGDSVIAAANEHALGLAGGSGSVGGLGFALAGAVGYGVASVLQAIGARGTAGTLRTIGHPAYLAGLGVDALAWLSSLVALRTLPVYEVQAVLAGSLAVTVLVARVVLAARLGRRAVAAVAVAVVALAVLAASSGPQPAPHLAEVARWGVALVAVPVALAGWAATRAGSARAAAVLAGLAYGGTAVCARVATVPADPVHHPGHVLATLAADPPAWALAGYGIAGTLLYAYALEHGQVGRVTALLWAAEVVVPSGIGVLLLGDTVRSGWWPATAVAFAAAVVAPLVLATAGELTTAGEAVPTA